MRGILSVIKTFTWLHNPFTCCNSLTHFIGSNLSDYVLCHCTRMSYSRHLRINCIYMSVCRLFLLQFCLLLVSVITRSLQRPWESVENLFVLCGQTLRCVYISSLDCEILLDLFLIIRMALLCRGLVLISDLMFIPYIMALCHAW